MDTIRYQIAILGRPWFNEEILETEIRRQFADLGISENEYVIIPEAHVDARNNRAPFVAIFLGYAGADSSSHPSLAKIIEDSLPIIPCVDELTHYQSKVPFELESTNGLGIGQGEALRIPSLVACIMENLSLLRTDRRVFISYRRNDTRQIALQLYDALQARNFDTFLDTHSIRPGVEMQDHLWHRLADSDVVILLDSPDYRAGQWTIEEQARANSTSVQILHVLWPNVEEDAYSALSEFHQLACLDFSTTAEVGLDARLRESAVSKLCILTESLRARALTLRHTYLVDQFCDLCRESELSVTLHPERYITFEKNGETEMVFPAVGVPNAYRIHQIENAVRNNHTSSNTITIIFDDRGLLKSWTNHINWLNSHLKVRSLAATDLKLFVGDTT